MAGNGSFSVEQLKEQLQTKGAGRAGCNKSMADMAPFEERRLAAIAAAEARMDELEAAEAADKGGSLNCVSAASKEESSGDVAAPPPPLSEIPLVVPVAPAQTNGTALAGIEATDTVTTVLGSTTVVVKKPVKEEKPSDVGELMLEDVAGLELSADMDDLRWVGTQGKKLTSLVSIAKYPRLITVNLRSNLVKSFSGVQNLLALTSLELYDNRLKKLQNLEKLVSLTNLDLSFNRIKRIDGLSTLTKLKTLYLANNRISEIPEGSLATLQQLTMIDLGANKLRRMAGVETLTKLKELWIGKNKITAIEGIGKLTRLERLDIQSNRLTSLKGLPLLPSLLEFYVSHNGIASMDGVQQLPKLDTLDLSHNQISDLKPARSLTKLTEFWMNHNQVTDFKQVEELAEAKLGIKTIYLESNPLAKDFQYRKRLAAMFPTLEQLDATHIRR